MKTVSYKDRDGLIVVETYLDYIESYEEGNVPKQMIDVNGALVDSDKLYEIIYKAGTRAIVREAIKEQEILDERIKDAPWYLKPRGQKIVIILILIYATLPQVLRFKYDLYDLYDRICVPYAAVFFLFVTVYLIKYIKYGITDKYRYIIDNYEAEKKRFNRKKRRR